MPVSFQKATFPLVYSDLRAYKALFVMKVDHVAVVTRSGLLILVDAFWIKSFLHRVDSFGIHEFWVIVSGTSSCSAFMRINKWLEPKEVLWLLDYLRRNIVLLRTRMLDCFGSLVFLKFAN